MRIENRRMRYAASRVLTFFILLTGIIHPKAGWGKSLDIPPLPRVLSMSPNITEIIEKLGAGDCLVGVSDYCSPLRSKLPRCGGSLNPNFERILAAHPQVIFLLGKMERFQQFAERHRMESISVTIDSFSDLLDTIEAMAQRLNRKEVGRELIEQLRNTHHEIQHANHINPPIRALLVLERSSGGLQQIMSVNQVSFLGEMLSLAGGENIFAETKQAYFMASLEAVLAKEPEIIFELRPGKNLTPTQIREIQKDWMRYKQLPAVKNQKVVVLTEDFLKIPGPRMLKIAQEFARHLQAVRN
jgi:iron complex transport system substrate-binding protein